MDGLRREEVALFAGISPDYYLRLERGRDKNPSSQVLESLARVLLLDDVERTYLLGLAAARPRVPRRKRPEHVPARVHELLAHLQIPAFVEGRAFDVLAANPMAVDDVILVVYYPDKGSDSDEKLGLLAALSPPVTPREPASGPPTPPSPG